jgi:hypothetical protein
MLIANTPKRSANVVASNAKAKRRSWVGQALSAQRTRGAKHVVTSRSRRCTPLPPAPFLSWASWYASCNRWRTVFSFLSSRGASAAATLVKPHDCASTMPKLHSASTTACGLLRWGRCVLTSAIQLRKAFDSDGIATPDR